MKDLSTLYSIGKFLGVDPQEKKKVPIILAASRLGSHAGSNVRGLCLTILRIQVALGYTYGVRSTRTKVVYIAWYIDTVPKG